MKTEKIAVSMSRALLEMVDEQRGRTGETRSAFVRRALGHLFASTEQARKVAEYRAGYGRDPETDEEVQAAEASASSLLAGEPWE